MYVVLTKLPLTISRSHWKRELSCFAQKRLIELSLARKLFRQQKILVDMIVGNIVKTARSAVSDQAIHFSNFSKHASLKQRRAELRQPDSKSFQQSPEATALQDFCLTHFLMSNLPVEHMCRLVMLQSRVRICQPPPHVALHSLHADHVTCAPTGCTRTCFIILRVIAEGTKEESHVQTQT